MAGILTGVGIGLAAILAIGFTAVKVHSCREQAERDAAEAQQREDAKRCADSWSTADDPRCAALQRRKQQAAADAPVTCDKAAPRERLAWIDRPNKLRPDNATPRALGFSDDGDECAVRLVTRALDCSQAEIRGAIGDSPYLREAREHGFQWLICEHGSERKPYRLGDIIR